MPSNHTTPFTFPVSDLKRIETALDYKGYRNYICVVDVLSLPPIKDWNANSNVRDAKSRGKVPDAIREGLIENELFVYMNRGILLMAESMNFDNAKKQVTVNFKHKDQHGIGDGGHTRLIISEEAEALIAKKREEKNPIDRQVKVEILVGFDLSETRDIVGARNTSNQVKPQGLLELGKEFDPLKKHLKDERYFEEISFKEYELFPGTDKPKPIDVMDIISVMTMFDTVRYDSQHHPIIAYSSKARCLTNFEEAVTTNGGNNKLISSYERLYPIVPDLLRLRDTIYLNLPEIYNTVGKEERSDVTGGKFGNLTGVVTYDKPTVHLPFLVCKAKYRIPMAFIFPLLAAFRVFLELGREGHYKWIDEIDPFELLKGNLGRKMVLHLTTKVLEDKNPNKTGKSTSVWANCYSVAEGILKDIKLARKDIRIARLEKELEKTKS